MEQTIITKTQKIVLATVAAEPMLKDFYLTGGTALAGYYLHHRISDDLDFFISHEPDTAFLHAFAERLKRILGADSVRFEHVYDRNIFFFSLASGELKIEFTQYPFLQLAAPIIHQGVRVDALRDIAANKCMALIDRFDPKDFIDLFFILKERQLEEVRQDAEKKFGITISGLLLGGELVKVSRINALPKMIQPITIKELKVFFAAEAKKLEKNILQ